MKKITLLICIFTLGFIPTFAFGFAPENDISFYQTDLVCRAAPHIGCGSASKPILLNFMKQDGVKEAWLNREGTVIAVVWEENTTVDKKAIAASVFGKRQQSYQEITGDDYQVQLERFQNREQWYLGEAVDELTKEEMEYIMSGKSPSCSSSCSFTSKSCNIDWKNCSKSCSLKRARAL